MSAIGVIDGMDGKFNPTGTLTREQGAKIISYMLLGKTGGDALSATAAPFDDVAADRWSAGAIAYCKNVGILGGVGDNKFQPEAALTGAAFGKMLLTALGYDATKEGLGGSDWSLNVARLINKIDLADGLGGLGYSTAITRDEAAKLAFNTLTKTMVEYPGAFTVKTSDGTVVDSATQAEAVENTAYSYISRANNAGWTALEGAQAGGEMQFCENYFPSLKMEITTDAFGVQVNKWFNGNNRTDYVRDKAKTVASVDGDDLLAIFTEATTPKKIRNAIGGSSADLLRLKALVEGAPVALAAGDTNKLVVYIDGVLQDVTEDGTAAWVGTGTTEIASTGNGVVTRVYRDADTNNVTITINGVYLAKALANYNTKDSKLAIQVEDQGSGYAGGVDPAAAWPNEVKSEDFDNLEGYKKDDLMLITATNDGEDWTIRTVTPVTNAAMGVTVSAYRAATFAATDNGTVTANGTTYKYNRSLKEGIGFAQGDYSINSGTYNLCLDDNGYVIGIKEVEATYKADDYLFVRASNVSGFKAEAKVTFMDGTESTITVAKVTEGGTDYTPAGSNELRNHNGTHDAGEFTQLAFYKFSKKSNGEYNLTVVTEDEGITQNHTSGYMLAGVLKPIFADNNEVVNATANSKSVAVANKKVYVGVANFPRISDTDHAKDIYYLLDGTTIIAVYTGASGSSTSDTTKYAYLWGDKITGKDGDDKFYTYNAIVDGELTTIESEDEKAMGLYDISTTDGKGWVELGDVIDEVADDAAGLVTYYAAGITGAARKLEVKNGTLLNDGASVAVVNDSTRYFSINATKTAANVEEIGDGSVLTLDTTKTWTVYVFRANDSAKVASMVYFVRTL